MHSEYENVFFCFQFYTDFGDILKSLVNKCRELDKLGCARAVIVSLCNFYEEMKVGFLYCKFGFIEMHTLYFLTQRPSAYFREKDE